MSTPPPKKESEESKEWNTKKLRSSVPNEPTATAESPARAKALLINDD